MLGYWLRRGLGKEEGLGAVSNLFLAIARMGRMSEERELVLDNSVELFRGGTNGLAWGQP